MLITIDTLRADRLGVYGARLPTPRLDALARRGVWFTSARTPVPLTLPSHASILTGLHPLQHGVLNNGSFRLGPEALSLAEILSQRGWRTGAVVASFTLDAQFGLAQGFEEYDDPLSGADPGGLEGPERAAASVTERALDWLRRRGDGPFFLWVHYFDPHTPYAPPEPFRSALAGVPYDAEVAYVDQEVGRLLDALVGAGAIVAVAGDHGEALGEHGESTHGLFLYDAVLRVPLILAGPGVPESGADARAASTLDLFPTLLSLLDIPSPADLPGRDLLAGDHSAPFLAVTHAPCLVYGWRDFEAVVDADLKLIRGAAAELYDLASDAGEVRDLSAARPDETDRLQALLQRRRAQLVAEGSTVESAAGGSTTLPGQAHPPDVETRARLESLGYLAGGSGASGACRSGPDPRSKLPLLRLIDRGVAEYHAGRHEGAAAEFRSVLRQDPGNIQAHYYLGTALRALGRHRQAAAEFGAAARRDPTNLAFIQDEAMSWFEAGDAARAEERLRAALASFPDVPKTRFLLGSVLLAAERAADALAELDAARAAMPPNPDLEYQRARALVLLGRRGDAIEALRAACALAPERSGWHGTLAGLLTAEGRPTEAAQVLRTFLAAHPDDPLALYNLAVLMEAAGDSRQALDLYRRADSHWTGDARKRQALRVRIRALERPSTSPR